MQIGVDNSYNGAVVVSKNNIIIDAILYPKKLKVNNHILNLINNKFKNKDISFFKERYNQNYRGFNASLFSDIRREKYLIKLNTGRQYNLLFDFYKKYKNTKIAYLEAPLKQTFNKTSIDGLLSGHVTNEIHTMMLTFCNISYRIESNKILDKTFNYSKAPKDADKKEFRKSESIRIASEQFKNIEEFWKPGKCIKIHDGICEAALFSKG